MTDSAATEASASRAKKDEVIEDAVVVDEATGTPVVVEEAATSPSEPVIATDDPAAAQTSAPAADPAQRVVYVQVPAEPRKLGNRGVGSLIAIAAAVVFTAILAVVYALIAYANSGVLTFAFLARAEFYAPALFFVIGFVLLVLIVNRANWWAFIIGSLLVGVVVYLGSIGLTLLGTGIVSNTPDVAAGRFAEALRAPFFIVAALLAREVALWTGGIISRRGRRLRARNLENRAAYERELASTRAEHERANAAAAATA
ncbi:hypothetical protein BH09ACT5_BH09ACT5_18640 [soil metagenome]